MFKFLHFHGALHLTTAPSFSDLHFWFVTNTKFPCGKPHELLWTLIHSITGHLSSLLTAALSSCKDQWDAGPGYSGRGREQITSSERLQEHWWNHSEIFHATSFPHSRFANPVLALSLHKMWGSISEPLLSLCSPRAARAMNRMEHAMAQAAHIHALSPNYSSVCIF